MKKEKGNSIKKGMFKKPSAQTIVVQEVKRQSNILSVGSDKFYHKPTPKKGNWLNKVL